MAFWPIISFSFEGLYFSVHALSSISANKFPSETAAYAALISNNTILFNLINAYQKSAYSVPRNI
jgi:hypothetical protein